MSLPVDGSNDRRIASSTGPVGPLTTAPMLAPSSAVTWPFELPKVTELRRMATPPFSAGPTMLTWRGALVSANDMKRVTTESPSAFGADVAKCPVTAVEKGTVGMAVDGLAAGEERVLCAAFGVRLCSEFCLDLSLTFCSKE